MSGCDPRLAFCRLWPGALATVRTALRFPLERYRSALYARSF